MGSYKGDYRALVGLFTWMKEKERLESGIDKYEAHFSSFIEANEKATRFLEDKKIKEELERALGYWKKTEHLLEREPGGNPIAPPPERSIRNISKNGFNVISLFSGAFGLDLGFAEKGFEHGLALDIEENSTKTLKANIPELNLITDDIGNITTEELLSSCDLKRGEVDVLVGGPPCQPFSPAGKRASLDDPRASPLKEFIRVIKEAQPRCFVMEEVKGLMSARIKHVSIKERSRRVLLPEEEKGSAFEVVLAMLKSTGYNFKYKILNAADFGTPQSRERLIFIGLKEGVPNFPMPTHGDSSQQTLSGGKIVPWTTFWETSVDLQGKNGQGVKLSKKRSSFLDLVPPGGNWRQLSEDVQEEAMGGAYKSGGGKMGFYRRLAWDEPSPTVVTSPIQSGTMFCHPEMTRPLNIEEYKRIQGFPDDWILDAPLRGQYKLIGNAVPVNLSYAIAGKVVELLTE